MTARAATIPTIPTRHINPVTARRQGGRHAVGHGPIEALTSGESGSFWNLALVIWQQRLQRFFARVFSNVAGHWRMFVSKASRYAFRISHNVYFDNQLKTGKDRVVSSSAFALSTVGILLSAFGLRQMGHNQKWIERG
ncbi:uncharacterized protein LOC119393295 [Rhipicephalus sanguineus]|uniref:uncharacterized protein LOC119393295 n=1 Tax=Rhipicephalus sanguineus TaxID=34632 RepID=UPI001894294B|nr:uncharacterized protein LOC119393295 [Rhipicephalus sanguineus]